MAPTKMLTGKSLEHASHGLWGSAGLKMLIHTHFIPRAILTCSVGQNYLVFGVQSGFISRSMLCMQDYKSLCAAATICASLINIQMHRHTDSSLTTLYE